MPTFTGTEGDDIVIGTDAADIINGRGGNDILDGRGGGDTIEGGDGDDVIHGGSGTNVYNGGAGFDTLTYENWLGGGVEVNLSPYSGPATASTGSGTSVVTSNIVFFERIVGSRFADRLTAYGAFATTLDGGDGDDYLVGGGSGSTLIGGRGADYIYGGGGNELIIAEGNDTIFGNYGFDTVRLAGSYADYVVSTEIDFSQTIWTVLYSANERIRVFGVERFEFSDTVVTGTLTLTPRILGTSGADRLVGTGSIDLINGGAGNDFLIGGGGNDILEGDLGIDTAGYSGLRRSYTLTHADGLPVTVSDGPEGGRDRLSLIERLSFLDGTVVFGASSTAAQVYRLYHSAYGAEPNQTDLAFWVGALDAGLGLRQVAEVLVSTSAFVARFGGLSNEALVRAMYYQSLQRGGDPDGLASWTARANSLGLAGILLAFSESAEHQTVLAPATNAGIFVEDGRTISLARLYDTAFDRLPDHNGIINWRGMMESGASLQAIADVFVASQEFQTLYGGLSNQDFVRQLYRLSLNREPDPQGLENWTARLDTGTSPAELVLLFSESVEHVGLTSSFWAGGVRYLGASTTSVVEEFEVVGSDMLVLPDGSIDSSGYDDCWNHPQSPYEALEASLSPSVFLPEFDPMAQGQQHADWL